MGNVNFEEHYYEVDIQHGAKLQVISADKEYINIWINQCKHQGSINGRSLLYFYSSESQPAKTSTNRNTP